MAIEFFFAAVIILLIFAIFDLAVGVSNDAVNFLNSSIGSGVAPLKIILIVASAGIIAGVMFSSGMMEVARRGIFHPQLFTMPELMTVFLAVMLADILILDLFNTYGMPTSTTVSIVFELLGAAVAVSIMKILSQDESLTMLGQYINSAKAMTIIMGIFLSVAIAFICGALVQSITRLLFTFDYKSRIKLYGALWGGAAAAFMAHFILVKGASGAAFLGESSAAWIKNNGMLVMAISFGSTVLIFQALIVALKINIFKPLVLLGTFALAMAFAANDLVNFIGVPLAGLQAYRSALKTPDPLTATMEALQGKLHSETYFLVLAGIIMVVTLWLSRKARTVTETEVNLARQDEGIERFGSSAPTRIIVRTSVSCMETLSSLMPRSLRRAMRRRYDQSVLTAAGREEPQHSFDLIRASVNLMVASAVVSFGTSLKLPLSTTYVTFMVAMGTSFADRAWGKDTAVSRVTGVLTVIGGWFFTAIVAFCTALTFAFIMSVAQIPGMVGLLALAGFIMWRSHRTHKERTQAEEENRIFNLKKVTNAREAVFATFQHTATYLEVLRGSIEQVMEALASRDLAELRRHKRLVKKTQVWSNIITANIFKAMRLLQREDVEQGFQYGETIRCLQSLTESHRDFTLRAYIHISENHNSPLLAQVKELRQVVDALSEILKIAEETLSLREPVNATTARARHIALDKMLQELAQKQVERIRNRSSKTRLSILYYAVLGDARRISRQSIKLLNIFHQSFNIRTDPG